MKLYRYIDAPITLIKSSTQPLHLEVSPPATFLAIANDGTTYLEMKEEQISTCRYHDGNYFCPILGKFKKQRRSCTTALYYNRQQEIEETCPLVVARPESRAERINKNQWLLIEPEDTYLLVNCNEEYNRTAVRGTYIITLKEGCTVNTDSVTLTAPKYEGEVVMNGKISQSQASPYQWIEEGEATHFQQTAMELLQHVGQKAKLSEIRALTRFKSKMESLHAPRWKLSLPHWFMHGVFPSLSTILLIAVVWFLIRGIVIPVVQRWRNDRKNRANHSGTYHRDPDAISLHGPEWDLNH